MEQQLEVLTEILRQQTVLNQDHETRIRVLEQKISIAIGAIGILGGLLAFVASKLQFKLGF